MHYKSDYPSGDVLRNIGTLVGVAGLNYTAGTVSHLGILISATHARPAGGRGWSSYALLSTNHARRSSGRHVGNRNGPKSVRPLTRRDAECPMLYVCQKVYAGSVRTTVGP